MKKKLITIKPVGGVGQIGSNMTLVEYKNNYILIDAGILFPYEDFFDIDYLIPDLSKIPTPQTLIITHGHEDHIGAIYHIIEKFPDIKIYAPSFAAALIRKKLEFNKKSYPISIYRDIDTLSFDELLVDPIHVNHSIPDTYGLLFRIIEKKFSFLFVSDFKIDFKTQYEAPIDFPKLKRLTEKLNKKILFADSTNITSSTHCTPSEFDIIPSFESIISNANARIFITLFSSNVHRIKTIIDLAEKYQFKVVPYGRSMVSYLNTAIEEGIIEKNERAIKSSDSTKGTEENIIVLLSGCQGDFLGTFRRVAMGEDSLFKIRSSDTFVISSKAIPGNEKKINLLLNKISSVGCQLFSPSDLPLHVSGHPGKDDLTLVYKEYGPTDVIPIHGEVHFLREHIEHVKKSYPSAQTHFLLNHDEIHFDEDLEIQIQEGEKLEPVIYHGKHIILEKEKISERRKMACNGSVFLSVKLDSNRSKLGEFNYHLLGIPQHIFKNEDHFRNFLHNEISNKSLKDIESTKEEIRVAIRRYFDFHLGYKPTTVVHIL